MRRGARAEIHLRPTRPEDLALLTRFAIAFNDEDGHPLSPGGRRALKALCEGTPHGCAWIVESGGTAVGYIVIGLGFSVEYGGVDAFLDELYIENAHRGHGVGTAALEAMAKLARRMKVKALHLEAMPTNDRATRLYSRVGFQLSERRLMSRRL